MFKPREILEEEALVECRPVKSVFLETLSEDDIIQYVKEALLYTNVCVENERSFVIKICTEWVNFWSEKEKLKCKIFPWSLKKSQIWILLHIGTI